MPQNTLASESPNYAFSIRSELEKTQNKFVSHSPVKLKEIYF